MMEDDAPVTTEPASPAPDYDGEGAAQRQAGADKIKRYKLWQSRIKLAKKLRKDWEEEYRVKDLENFYLGKHGGSVETVFNHFAATLKAEQPELFFTNPKFLVRPKPGKSNPVNQRMVARAEGVLQAIAEQDCNLEVSGELGTIQSFFRIGVLKAVFDPQLEPNPAAGKPIYMHGADGAPVANPENPAELMPLVDPQTMQPVVEPDFVMKDEIYRWEWVDAKKMLLPDQGPDQRKWSWIGEEITVTLEEAQNDIRFPAELRSRLKCNSTRDPERDKNATAYSNDGRDDDEEMFTYCECYDIRQKRWYILADGQEFDDFLIDATTPDGVEDHPYAILAFDPILGPVPNPWPKPQTFDWRPVQKEYNTRRNQITEGAKRTARKIGYDDGTFPDEDAALLALRSSVDMEAVKLNSVRNPWVTIVDPNQSPDLYKDVALLKDDYRLISGQTGANLGAPDADTATEATFAQRASSARTADKRKVITRWLRQAGRKMLQLVQGTMTLQMWVNIKGMDDKEILAYGQQMGIPPMMLNQPGIKEMLLKQFGERLWVQTSREELTFSADVDITPGSTQNRTIDLERREAFEFMKIIGAMPHLLLSRELTMWAASFFETVPQSMVEELLLVAQQMVMATAARGGQQGDNSQGGGPGPTEAQNALTALAGSVQ